jgi:hypothetical protein
LALTRTTEPPNEPRVAADPGLVGSHVHRVVVPVLHGHDGHVGAVTDDDLEVAGVHAGATVVEHERELRVRARLEHVVRVAAPAGRPGDGEAQRLVEHGVGRHLHVQRVGRVARRDRRGAVVGHQRGAAGRLPRGQRAHEELRRAGRLVGRGTLVARRVVEHTGEALERGEPPDLLTPGGHRVVVEVERRHRVQVGLHRCQLEGGLHALARVGHGHFGCVTF